MGHNHSNTMKYLTFKCSQNKEMTIFLNWKTIICRQLWLCWFELWVQASVCIWVRRGGINCYYIWQWLGGVFFLLLLCFPSTSIFLVNLLWKSACQFEVMRWYLIGPQVERWTTRGSTRNSSSSQLFKSLFSKLSAVVIQSQTQALLKNEPLHVFEQEKTCQL